MLVDETETMSVVFQTGQFDRTKKLHTMCHSSCGSSTSNEGCGSR